MKANNKLKLAQYLEEKMGITINPASMFDIQVLFVQEARESFINAILCFDHEV